MSENAYVKIYFPFLDQHLIKIRTSGHENSCYFHSILSGCSQYYKTCNESQRNAYARRFRDRLADELLREDEDGKTVYSKLGRGYYEEYSKCVSNLPGELDYSLEGMLKLLRGKNMIDHSVQELVSNIIDIDIYLLNEDTRECYPIAEGDENILYKNRESIIIGYSQMRNHYSIFGLLSKDGKPITVFDCEHFLIQNIRKRDLFLAGKIEKFELKK